MESNWVSMLLSAAAMVMVELLYFNVANRFNIIDRPNERSSHVNPIIRGGGVIFLVGALLWFFQNDFQWPFFLVAVVVIAFISFLDDLKSLGAGVRFSFHFIAIALLLYQLWPLPWPVYLIVLSVLACVATLNAFNFMDGINGMAGTYALVALVSFISIDRWVVKFTDLNLLVIMLISTVIFLFFNFRKRAKCFAGDVGSVTIALILIFVLLQLIRTTGNFLWPLLFLVYGTDSIVTIIYRLRRKENILKAHRSHLYQYLSNEFGMPQLWVSFGYGAVQGLINVGLVIGFSQSNYVLIVGVTVIFVGAYLFLRQKVQAKIQTQIVKG